jgi:hypothetical protein
MLWALSDQVIWTQWDAVVRKFSQVLLLQCPCTTTLFSSVTFLQFATWALKSICIPTLQRKSSLSLAPSPLTTCLFIHAHCISPRHSANMQFMLVMLKLITNRVFKYDLGKFIFLKIWVNYLHVREIKFLDFFLIVFMWYLHISSFQFNKPYPYFVNEEIEKK